MRTVIIITGTSRGLGKALVELGLKCQDSFVISISRSIDDEHRNISINKFFYLKCDLSLPLNYDILETLDTLIRPHDRIYFFNNAGAIDPIRKVGKFTHNDIQNSIRVNIEYPVNIINYLISQFKSNIVFIINITSGAGRRSIENWSLYSAAKAYMNHFLTILELECKIDSRVSVLSIDPGVMNTSMQTNIRNSDFPDKDQFIALEAERALSEPIEVAKRIFEKIQLQ